MFDTIALEAVRRLEERWHDELGLVEFAVEETPIIDDADLGAVEGADSVPLASLVRGSGGASPRVVLFRRPLEQRAESRAELAALVLVVLVEQVAEMLGRPPEEIDPGYDVD